MVQSGIYSLVLFEAFSNFVVELHCPAINIHIHVAQLFEHVLQHIEALLVPVQTGQVEAISVIGLHWAHQELEGVSYHCDDVGLVELSDGLLHFEEGLPLAL